MDSLSAAQAVGACIGVFIAWTWWAYNRDHDDDDEVYLACFHPSVSPVATPHAFVKILERIPVGGRVLDVGVGSGTYLLHEPCAKVLRERKLMIDGVDISAPNIDICKERIASQGLSKHFTAQTIDARELPKNVHGSYDAVLFMESFPVMPRDLFVDILKAVQCYLKPGGVNYLYHNLSAQTGVIAAVAGVLKPVARVFIGIDFGYLTSRPMMDALLEQSFPGKKIVSQVQQEVLLACTAKEAKTDFSKVRNLWYRCWCSVFQLLLQSVDYKMEQHLITFPAVLK